MPDNTDTYTVLRRDDLSQLIAVVNEHIATGWSPLLGGFAIEPNRQTIGGTPHGHCSTVYYQVMTRDLALPTSPTT